MIFRVLINIAFYATLITVVTTFLHGICLHSACQFELIPFSIHTGRGFSCLLCCSLDQRTLVHGVSLFSQGICVEKIPPSFFFCLFPIPTPTPIPIPIPDFHEHDLSTILELYLQHPTEHVLFSPRRFHCCRSIDCDPSR
ncbi:uncharacterized protein BO95DRAFT_46504 [Aspergillus brunneoviolaceus CBS 621.78]|uniref:Uncharacterized protein n=1 Tax=Aspergillus brunneoviolaceus CBS 621.78 TaxID=1450534 RepID=A0ACD1FRQ4_9EURO|nr:hypothetical protein BO95DRAFT_46504 [Aspergillus brunneoviolaceus CBS 621.78]RAH39647.1 hypothetical protein BO95DRAFT_46504 [Aspergillus brunneoviolaceus CBS 621.78]